MNLNIICLHGFTQNSTIYKKKLARLIRSNQNINLYFLNGPVKLAEANNPVDEPKAYWIYDLVNPLNVEFDYYDSETKLYHLEDSLKAFIDLGNQIHRVDGIIGFSQGACFADYICKLYAKNQIPFDLKFAVFISGRSFDKPDPSIKPKIKTLHMYGEVDTIVTNELSIQLADCYDDKVIFSHNGAHIIPSNSSAKTVLKNFISSI